MTNPNVPSKSTEQTPVVAPTTEQLDASWGTKTQHSGDLGLDTPAEDRKGSLADEILEVPSHPGHWGVSLYSTEELAAETARRDTEATELQTSTTTPELIAVPHKKRLKTFMKFAIPTVAVATVVGVVVTNKVGNAVEEDINNINGGATPATAAPFPVTGNPDITQPGGNIIETTPNKPTEAAEFDLIPAKNAGEYYPDVQKFVVNAEQAAVDPEQYFSAYAKAVGMKAAVATEEDRVKILDLAATDGNAAGDKIGELQNQNLTNWANAMLVNQDLPTELKDALSTELAQYFILDADKPDTDSVHMFPKFDEFVKTVPKEAVIMAYMGEYDQELGRLTINFDYRMDGFSSNFKDGIFQKYDTQIFCFASAIDNNTQLLL